MRTLAPREFELARNGENVVIRVPRLVLLQRLNYENWDVSYM
jgi:hypothetical protein